MIYMERSTLKTLIADYIAGLETELTADACLCGWVIVDTHYGKRKVRVEENAECPVHTREGLILHFILTRLSTNGDASILGFTDDIQQLSVTPSRPAIDHSVPELTPPKANVDDQ